MVAGPTGISGCLLTQLFPAAPQSVMAQAAEIRQNEVVVVEAVDRIDLVLNQHHISYQKTARRHVVASLDEAKYLFVGCGKPLFPGAPERIAEWVEAGGRLVTSDWMLHHLLETAFLDERRWPLVSSLTYRGDHLSADKDDKFPISESDLTDPTVNVLLEGGNRLIWKVTKSAYPIAIQDEQRVKVLARSDKLERQFPRGGALFVRFAYGRGEVLHLLAHWYDQEFEKAPPASTTSAITHIRTRA